MRIYRKSVDQSYVNNLYGAEDRFENLFGDSVRILIPFINERLNEIVDLLEGGETKSGRSYFVDSYKGVVFDKGEDGKVNMGRSYRLGKILGRELGIDFLDEWSKQANSLRDTDSYSIVASRAPIDVLRMSDHHDITSCHSPDDGYFAHAQVEAKVGGGIAYVVKNEDLEYISQHINDDELFSDSDRYKSGGMIEPIARLRINRYAPETGEGPELALPVDSIYGTKVGGFFEAVKRWIKTRQDQYIDYDGIDFSNYQKKGATYADQSDSNVFTGYFGKGNHGVRGNLNNEQGTEMVEIWNEELTEMMNNHNENLQFTEVYADAHIDEEAYIMCGIETEMRIRGILLDFPAEGEWQACRDIFNNLELYSLSEELKLEYTNENGWVTLKIRGYLDSVYQPDDFDSKAYDIVQWERNQYYDDVRALQSVLIESGLLRSFDNIIHDEANLDNDPLDKYFNHPSMALDGDETDLEFGPIISYVKTDCEYTNNKSEKDLLKKELYDVITSTFDEKLRSVFTTAIYQDKLQGHFQFYDEALKEQYRAAPVPSAIDYRNVNFGSSVHSMPAWRRNIDNENHKTAFIITLPVSVIYQYGKVFMDVLYKNLNYILDDIAQVIYMKDQEIQNRLKQEEVQEVQEEEVVTSKNYRIYRLISADCGIIL